MLLSQTRLPSFNSANHVLSVELDYWTLLNPEFQGAILYNIGRDRPGSPTLEFNLEP